MLGAMSTLTVSSGTLYKWERCRHCDLQVQIVGVTRSSEPRNSFVPDNNPAKDEWYWLEVPAMAKAAGLPPDTQMVQVQC